MKFTTFSRMIYTVYFVIIFTIVFLLFRLFESFDITSGLLRYGMGFIVIFALNVSFNKFYNKIVISSIRKRYKLFTDDLDTKHIQGIEKKYYNWATQVGNKKRFKANVDCGYEFHIILNQKEYPFIKHIDLGIEYRNTSQLIAISHHRILSLLQVGDLDEAEERIDQAVMLLEDRIDEQQVQEPLLEDALRQIAWYKSIKKFINNPNANTVGICLPTRKNNKYHQVLIRVSLAQVFLENDMDQEALNVLQDIVDFDGDYRLLRRAKEIYSSQ